MDRLESGQASLDLILGGGLPANAINLFVGLPGSGKTMLAEQYVFHNATPDRPAVYCATASEPFDKIVRYGQTLSFFDARSVGNRVFYEDLSPALQERALAGFTDRLTAILRERRPAILVIDSFKALQSYASDPLEYRRFVTELAARIGALPLAAFWVGEYATEDLATAPEFAVADSIIALGTEQAGDRAARSLCILKLRGSGFRSGSHAYRLTARGLQVFPRLADAASVESYAFAHERVSTGIDALDEMLDGGLMPSSSTLIGGPSGSGKTLLGLQLLVAGVRRGERGVVASMQENPTQLRRVMGGFGWTDDGLELMYRSPVDIYIDEWVYDLLETTERTGARHVLIDSLTDLRIASRDEMRFQEYMYSLVQRFTRSGIDLFMTLEASTNTASTMTSAISHLADTVILLRHIQENDRMTRNVLISKSRASRHDGRLRPFEITGRGFEIAAFSPPFAVREVSRAGAVGSGGNGLPDREPGT